MKVQPSWLILAFVALFIAIPFSTIPGLFGVISVLIGVLTLLLAVLLVASVAQRADRTR